MSNELTVINNQTGIQKPGGIGVNLGSRFFRPKPGTIVINQANTQAEGAIKGHFRIVETGQQFPEMRVVLLQEPFPRRNYYVGEQGALNRKAENLMCFSRDLVKPHPDAQMPQSLTCAGCAKADWAPYRDAKKKGKQGQELRSLIPPCEEDFFAMFIDTVFKLPLKMYIQSKSKATFLEGMDNVTRTIITMQSQGLNPNIFDVAFTMKTTPEKNFNGTITYVLKIADAKAVTDEDKVAFGEIYNQYASVNNQKTEEAVTTEQVAQVNADVDKVVEGQYVDGGETITV